jgi:hypothetical protein
MPPKLGEDRPSVDFTGHQTRLQNPLEARNSPHKAFANHKISPEDSIFVNTEIDRLLRDGIIVRTPKKPKIISPIGVVPKKNGKKRMILDLRFLNSFIDTRQFRLETIFTAAKQMRTGDLMIKIDLKDGYFHIPVHKSHQTLLGFQWNGTFYKYRALPFGLSIAPFWFTKFLRPIVQLLRSRGFRLVSYVDDFLFLLNNRHPDKKVTEILATFRKFGLVKKNNCASRSS